MIKLLFAILLAPCILFAVAQGDVTLVYDMLNVDALPPRFRKMSDPLTQSDRTINTKGLSQLKASGSGQFSDLSFKTMLNRLDHPKKLVVIDLRDESHGFINGAAVTWYASRNWGNVDMSNAEAAADEAQRIADVKVGTNILISQIMEKTEDDAILRTAPNYVQVESVESEEKLVKKYGASYLRLRNVDHTAPSENEALAFEKFVKSLPEDTWIHLHCRGGKGRTTSFLVMLDIIKNGKDVSFEQILQRQQLIGGKDINDPGPNDSWKAPYFAERRVFLENFYNRVVNNQS